MPRPDNEEIDVESMQKQIRKLKARLAKAGNIVLNLMFPPIVHQCVLQRLERAKMSAMRNLRLSRNINVGSFPNQRGKLGGPMDTLFDTKCALMVTLPNTTEFGYDLSTKPKFMLKNIPNSPSFETWL
jgi:hypothetical protein